MAVKYTHFVFFLALEEKLREANKNCVVGLPKTASLKPLKNVNFLNTFGSFKAFNFYFETKNLMQKHYQIFIHKEIEFDANS